MLSGTYFRIILRQNSWTFSFIETSTEIPSNAEGTWTASSFFTPKKSIFSGSGDRDTDGEDAVGEIEGLNDGTNAALDEDSDLRWNEDDPRSTEELPAGSNDLRFGERKSV